jgi:hypothetical protein
LPRIRTIAITAATTVTLAVGALAVPSFVGSASAADDPVNLGAQFLQSVATGQTIDVSGGHMAENQPISEWSQHSGRNQQWWFQKAGNHYKIKSNVNGAYCLARERDGDTAKILLRGCDTHLADWDFVSLGGDRYRLKDPAANLYLNTLDAKPVRGRSLVTSPNTNTGAQWYLTDVNFRKQPVSGEKRLHDVTFLTAHNAHVASGDAWWIAPNQSLGIRGQLDAGVRGLMLDTHVYWHQPYLCHTNDSSCGWAPGVHYGSPRRSVQWALETVVKFLNEPANRNEIVAIFLEDYVAAHDLKAVLDRTGGLNDLLFRADAFGVKQNGWPKVSDVVAQNKRLLIFSDRSDREYFGVMSGHGYTVENYWSLGGNGSDTDCRSRWDDVPLNREEAGFRRLFVMNQFRDIPSRPAASSDNGSKLRWRANEVCAAAARRKANFVAVDFAEVPGNEPRALVEELNR